MTYQKKNVLNFYWLFKNVLMLYVNPIYTKFNIFSN